MQNPKFTKQDSLYEFPYHYLPSLEGDEVFRQHRYLSWGLEYMTYMSFVVKHIKQIIPESLCDVGCGDGRLIHMAKDIVPSIMGVDISERAISYAKAFNPDVQFFCEDVAELSKKYEMITLIEVLEHIPDEHIQVFINGVSHLLNSGGYLLVTVPTINVPLNAKHYRHYSLDLLADALSPHFEIQDHWWLYRRGRMERLLRKTLCNKFYLLNWSPLLKRIWNIHKRFTYHADNRTGSHLVCLARSK